MSRMPNTAMENGSHAVIGIGRSTWMVGSKAPAASRHQPIAMPSGTPTRIAAPNPLATRSVENSALSSHVPL